MLIAEIFSTIAFEAGTRTGTVIECFGSHYAARYHPYGYILLTLHAIRSCRTVSLGCHVDRCDSCKHLRISFNCCLLDNPACPNPKLYSTL